MVQLSVPSGIVWFSDRPKTKRKCPDFRHCLKAERFENRTIINCPKSEHVRILDVLCNLKATNAQSKSRILGVQLSTASKQKIVRIGNLIDKTSVAYVNSTFYFSVDGICKTQLVQNRDAWESELQTVFHVTLEKLCQPRPF